MKLNFLFIDELYKFILNNDKLKSTYNFSNKKQKYKLEDILESLFYILKPGISWREFIGPIKWSSLYYHFSLLTKNDVFKLFYKFLIAKYFSQNRTNKLKYTLIDSTIFYNKYGKNFYGNKFIGRNKYYKNKNISKLSLITDSNGIPFSIILNQGNINDANLFFENFNNLLIHPKTEKYKTHNRYSQYFLADKEYDSNRIRKILQEKGIR